jgi:hypothetical protein
MTCRRQPLAEGPHISRTRFLPLVEGSGDLPTPAVVVMANIHDELAPGLFVVADVVAARRRHLARDESPAASQSTSWGMRPQTMPGLT